MAGRTITRADLANAIHAKVKLPRADAAQIADQVLDEIVMGLERDGKVRLASFGTFEVRKKNERVGRNPKTGEEVPIEARSVVTFKASDILKKFVNGVVDRLRGRRGLDANGNGHANGR
ncbi:MAG: integration host factor subunit alpha [Pseudomonadota bacterium]